MNDRLDVKGKLMSAPKTDSGMLLIYNKAMAAMDYPFSSAVAVTMLVISCAIVYSAQKLFARLSPRH